MPYLKIKASMGGLHDVSLRLSKAQVLECCKIRSDKVTFLQFAEKSEFFVPDVPFISEYAG
jgi:hypothetical protein